MIKYLLLFIVTFAFGSSAMSQLSSTSRFYILDRSHSEMNFSIKWMTKGKVVGGFDNVSGLIYYDPQKPRDISASLMIDVKSLNTGNTLRNGTLMKDWFDTAAHAYAYFESIPVNQQDKPGKVKGKFTLKGITKIITLDMAKTDPPAADFESNPFIIVSGKTVISRKDFNVRMTTSRYESSQTNAIAISDSVIIEFNLYGRQISEKNALSRMGAPDNRTVLLYNLTKKTPPVQTKQVIDSFYNDPGSKRDISSWVLGNYYITANDFEKALIFLDKTDAVFPDNPNLFDSMMQYYYQLGNREETKKWVDKILKKNPHAPNALEYQKRLSKM